jgi:hypothetical protein
MGKVNEPLRLFPITNGLTSAPQPVMMIANPKSAWGFLFPDALTEKGFKIT